MSKYKEKILPWEDGYSETEEKYHDDTTENMSLDELMGALVTLREKWKNNYPKDIRDPKWPEFEEDKTEAEHIKARIEKLKKANESDTDCYQCQVKKAFHGSYFPFCCPECKEAWGKEHYSNKPVGPKYKTIEDCQRRLKELADQNRAKIYP